VDGSPVGALPLPELGVEEGSSDAALAALEQSAAPAPDDDEGSGKSSLTSAERPARDVEAAPPTAHTAERDSPAASKGAAASAKSGTSTAAKPSKAPKPIALEAKELRGLQVAELRALLVAERRRTSELTERLEKESPIAQAAIDEELKEGLAETATILSEGVAFLTDEPEAKLPPDTAKRLGRVWAPIVTRYAAEHAEYIPLANAIVATVAAVMDRAAAVKEARALRKELADERRKNADLKAA